MPSSGVSSPVFTSAQSTEGKSAIAPRLSLTATNLDQCEEALVVRNSSGKLAGWYTVRENVSIKGLPMQKEGDKRSEIVSPEDLEHFTVLSFDYQRRQLRRRECVVRRGSDAASYLADYAGKRPGGG